MPSEALITWHAPEHLTTEKKSDWYWVVGIITLSIVAVCFIFGQIITGIFVIVAVSALILHVSHPPQVIKYEINDRGIMVDDTLYSFLSLESFWIPHDEWPPRLILKSRKTLVPFIVIFINEVDPEEVREVLLKYIAETEHHEHLLKHLLERLGF